LQDSFFILLIKDPPYYFCHGCLSGVLFSFRFLDTEFGPVEISGETSPGGAYRSGLCFYTKMLKAGRKWRQLP